jgi:hypothetical protein
MRAVVEGIEAMGREEAAYWLGISAGPQGGDSHAREIACPD